MVDPSFSAVFNTHGDSHYTTGQSALSYPYFTVIK